ncbi:uncharacterized protein VICG_01307 [Vittaforma corneae ATCC 50505]|uniref:Uncharacterized protein n=1 Tax=Vittaforma corneae (strain ATCC 50505) TaxID=993615 RepID=L2GM27_VITCO|nr:uncharacterized protein VICG_01307 [Vittaforma corneae ATCC 50505]ELA41674.1 hypothetical protein VICG_01307 [Vittaforma corneae ATCC 50505]
MNSRNTSQDFAVKKEFIDLQLELRRFMDESAFFALQDILRDPCVVYGLDDYVNAYKETEDIKKIQKVLKKLLKYKKKNVNLLPTLCSLQEGHQPKETVTNEKKEDVSTEKPSFKNVFTFTGGFFSLKPVQIEQDLTKEKMLQLFKNQFKRIEPMKKIQIPKVVVSRTFSVSTSHSQLFKKIEKGAELSASTSQRNPNEITGNSAFRNGVMRNASTITRFPKATNTSGVNASVPSASQNSVVRATRSPYSNNCNPNPHEALVSSPKNKREKKNPDDSKA